MTAWGGTLRAPDTSDGIASGEVLNLLAALVEKCLVVEEGGRFRLLETVREYGRAQLNDLGESETLRSRHASVFLELAEEAEPHLAGPGQQLWLERLDGEYDNMRVALDWAAQDQRNGQLGLRLSCALWRFWYLRGHFAEGRMRGAAALSQSAAPTEYRSRVLDGMGVLAFRQGDYGAARPLHDQSLAINRQLGNRAGEAANLSNLAVLFQTQGEYSTSRTLYDQCLVINREVGNRAGESANLGNMGIVCFVQGKHDEARSLLEQSLKINGELGNDAGVANNLGHLGLVFHSQCSYAEARSYYEQALAINRRLGNRAWEASNLGNLGNLLELQGEYAAARSLHEEGLAICRELGNRAGESSSLGNLGNLARAQGDYASARSYLEQALRIESELGDRVGIVDSLDGIAATAAGLGQPKRAARIWASAARIREEIGTPMEPTARPEYDRLVVGDRNAVGAEAFEAAWAEGRLMTLEQAVEYALTDFGE